MYAVQVYYTAVIRNVREAIVLLLNKNSYKTGLNQCYTASIVKDRTLPS